MVSIYLYIYLCYDMYLEIRVRVMKNYKLITDKVLNDLFISLYILYRFILYCITLYYITIYYIKL